MNYIEIILRTSHRVALSALIAFSGTLLSKPSTFGDSKDIYTREYEVLEISLWASTDEDLVKIESEIVQQFKNASCRGILWAFGFAY